MHTYNSLKKIIKSNELLYSFYQSIRYPKAASVKNLFQKVNKKITVENLNGFYFDGKDSWVRVYDNLEFLYVNSQLGGLLELEKKTGFETAQIKLLEKNFHDGDIFVDIGANFGLYSIFVEKKFPNSSIHAFEPVPETFTILQKNIAHNLCSHIAINNIGLSNKNDILKFTCDKYAGNHIVLDPTDQDDTVSINVITLDEYAEKNNLSKIDFIKCDVEGAELFVLQGATKIITRDHPIILIEIHNNWTQRFNYTTNDVINYLISFGYKMKMIDYKTRTVEEYDPFRQAEIYDYIFYKNDIIL
ncbi:FkbM family methyltransferase [Sulfuricurvum sp. IAE1]|uniref:FkbM family methyltransferase n=1 Tax=Sulfuricurvum sp. IAE1 TaxID=2546102 RepID=UPI00104E2F38|nr:FkbM family methyltransferase [Sulfuricurvum sp. IAE1]TDA69577.1 FkbM family methyltransferase [Sulfuricurvum sp. IAE1]